MSLPLSFAQERLWFLDRLAPGLAVYNQPLALALSGPFDVPAWRFGLTEIARRHEVLRTSYGEVDDRPVQVIAAVREVPVPVVDLAGLPDGVRQGAAARLTTGFVRRPFDLAAGPLFRAALLRMERAEWIALLNLHHSIADGVALSLLLDELAALYAAYRAGLPSPLPELPLQYADYAVWQRGWLTGAARERRLAWWRQALAGLPEVLSLPGDRPRPAVQSFRGGRRMATLPAGPTAALARLGRERKSTLFMVLLAAFQAVLYRVTGEPDISIGSPVDGRDRTEVEGLLGLFLNTLVLRGRVEGGEPFPSLLARTRETALAAYAHQDLPFEILVADLPTRTDLGRNPLFQVMLAFQHEATAPPRLPGLAARLLDFEIGGSRVDLGLSVEGIDGTKGGLLLSLEYSADLFDAPTAGRLLGHYLTLLAAVAAGTEAGPIASLALLGEGEKHQLLHDWNTPPGILEPAPETVHQRFAAQAARTPDAVAIVALRGDNDEESLTYGELDRRADRLARRLLQRGTRPESRVGLLAGRSVDLAIGWLGIWKAGAAVLPLDPAQPDARLALFVADGAPALVLAERPLAGRAATLADGNVLNLEEEPRTTFLPPGRGEDGDGGRTGGGWNHGDLAYVIFTSGTSGRPKGVLVEHRSLAHTLAACQAAFHPTATDRLPVLAPAGFDIFLFELLLPLLAGGTAVLFDLQPILDPAALAAALPGMTLLHAVPALLRQVTSEVERTAGAVHSLRRVFVGGDAVPGDLLAATRRAFPAAVPTVLYGPTEATILAAAWEVDGEIPAERKPIGRPLPGVDLALYDRNGEPVPIGIAGELWIGGPGVARGYRGQPERTAERFVPAPGGERAYRTGDRMRWLPSGHLEFLGRIDQQLKIRGFRIEPGEVEAALREHPAVREAVVVARDDGPGGPRLAACLVAAPGQEIPLLDLAELARQRLPDYMVPALWTVLPALPLTAHGKVDRQALSRIELAPGPAVAEGYAPPETPTEELLAEIWAALLGVERVGRHDGFFALGGHSLLATQAISRLRDALGVELPVRALFEAPTPALLAREVERERSASTGLTGAAPPLVAVGRDHPLPLSFAQERLWLLDQLHPGSAYNLPFALELAGPLDVPAWTATLAALLWRHEALRTHFRPVDDGAVQEIAPPASPGLADLPLADLTALPEAVRQGEAERLAAAEARRPFDLAAGPLVRALLLRLGPTAHREVLNLHHAVADAWSMGVLTAELERLYSAFAARREPALPALPVQYADYAAWQRQWLQGAELARQLGYWRDRLADDHPTALPVDIQEQQEQQERQAGREGHRHPGAVFHATLPARLGRRLRAGGRERGATLFMTLFAGFAALLWRLAGNASEIADVTIGTPIANRAHRELEGLIGFFANTLALRVGLAGDPGFAGLLGRVREAALGAYDHQDLPFEKLVEELRPERRLDENPLFQTAFSLNHPLPGFAVPAEEGTGLVLTAGEIYPGTAKFQLALAVTDEPAGLAAAWEYRTDLFDAPTVARLARAWEVLLTNLIAEPERPLAEIPLLAAEERHQVAHEWNDTAVDYPREATLPELFARQVERDPGAIALVAGMAGGETLTYGDLDRRAQEIARRLVTLGVGPEVPVALALHRSFDLIAGILGILQAGGAYAPLDPDFPAERIRFLLEDTGAKIVLTHRNLAERLPFAGLSVLDLDLPLSRAEGGAVGRGGRGVRGLTADNLAYVLYTSGSTGLPKGVAVTHRNVVRLVAGTNYARFGPEEVFLQFAPVTFDASTFEIWGPLLHGGRLVLAPPGRVSLAELGTAIREGEVTTLWLTAGLFHQMVDEELPALAGVRQLLAGGDVVDPERVRAVLAGGAGLSGRALIDGYGPTEGTTFSCSMRLTNPDEIGKMGARIPIGRPIANTRAHVLDRGMEPAPIGVPGELYLGGDGLARGYLGRPDLTALRFVPDPSSAGGRLYRTGDRVRLRPDGRLDFLGRTDLQVKVAGHRIEPGEIEAVLALHPRIRESAVVALAASAIAERRLVAYVVPEKAPLAMEDEPDEPELRSWLRARLPEPLLPYHFVFLDRLPLTPHGKVDRAALPPPDPGRALPATPAAVPRTPTAEILAGLWAELLGLPRVDPGADFFALGGYSLLGTRLLAQVRRTFAVDLPLRALFEAPTVDGLADRIDRQREGCAAIRPPIPRLPHPVSPAESEVHPASLAQRRLWFLDRLAPGGFFLNVAHGLALTGELSPRFLEQGLREIVARHEPLRTTFTTADGQPAQRIEPPGETFQLPQVDLSGLPVARREPAAHRLLKAAAERPLDLVRGPLFHATLFRLAPDEHRLLLVPHHLVFDGASRGVLFHELEVVYGALARGLSYRLSALPVRYAEFAAWQRAAFAGPALAGQRGWWRERLAGLPPLDLPADHPRPPVQRFGGGFTTRALPAPVAADLLALCRRQGVTLFMALLALFETLLARWSGQVDFPIGAPVAGRSRPEVEELIGFFVNTLVLRADLAGEPTFSGLLARTRRTALDAYARQDLPFEGLVEELRPERHLHANPLFDVVLSLDEPPLLPTLPGIDVASLDLTGDVAHFDLTLIATRSPALASGLTLTLNHKRDLYEATTVLRMLEQLAALVARAVADPEAPALDLSPWSPAAWQQVVREWNDTVPVEDGATALARVEEQVARDPGALAVVQYGETGGTGDRLTYGELDRRANGLAWRLRQLGIAAGGRVALAFDRSPELAVAALAVWKAGAAYLPLDPAAPPERLAFMIADTAAPLVITRPDWVERFAGCAARILVLDGESGERAAGPTRERDRPLAAEDAGDVACVIYTSGSTGTPKGVEVRHSALANLIARSIQSFRLGPGDRASLVASPAFDASAWELWAHLSVGASLHVPPREIAVSARELLAWLSAERITSCFLPTPLAEGVLRQKRPAGLALRHLFAGGDRLRQAPPVGWELSLVNLYGPTECMVFTTTAELLPGTPGTPSIGRPIGGAEVYLVDSGLRPVPPGGRGELVIGGAGLARGYGGRPERTAERFVPHPFASRPGARLYRTGDLARHRANGEIEFLGRADGQVKVRGFRVEMGEIEAQLCRHPALREAAVIRRDDPTLGISLVAYVVPASPGGEAPSAPELRRFLAARLPEYMLPAAFVPLPTLPLTANGKIDRRSLPLPALAMPIASGAGAAGGREDAPANELERTISRLWCEVLHLSAVSSQDNFFEIGGQSLAMVAVHEKLQAAIGVEFPLVEMFESPTTRALAARLTRRATHRVEELAERPDFQPRASRQRGATAWKERARTARRPPRAGSHQGS